MPKQRSTPPTVKQVLLSHWLLKKRKVEEDFFAFFHQLTTKKDGVNRHVEEFFRFLGHTDDRRLFEHPYFAEYCTFVVAHWFKLANACFSRHVAHSRKKSCDLAEIYAVFKAASSRPLVSTVLYHYGAGEFLRRAANSPNFDPKDFWSLFDICIVLVAFYWHPSVAMGILMELCSVALGLNAYRMDLVEVFEFFTPCHSMCKTIRDNVLLLLHILGKKNYTVEVAVLEPAYTIFADSEAAKWELVDASGSPTVWTVVPLPDLVEAVEMKDASESNSEAREEHSCEIYVKICSREPEYRPSTYYLMAELTKKAQELMGNPGDREMLDGPKEEAASAARKGEHFMFENYYRAAVEVVREMLRGKVLHPISPQKLLHEKGWVSLDSIASTFEKYSRSLARPYIVEKSMIVEFLTMHDVVGRFERNCDYFRATDGHCVFAASLQRTIIVKDLKKVEDSELIPPEKQAWIMHEKGILKKSIQMIGEKMPYPLFGNGIFRLLFQATVDCGIEYAQTNPPVHQLDQDFSSAHFSGEKLRNAGFLEVDLAVVLRHFDVYEYARGYYVMAPKEESYILLPWNCFTGRYRNFSGEWFEDEKIVGLLKESKSNLALKHVVSSDPGSAQSVLYSQSSSAFSRTLSNAKEKVKAFLSQPTERKTTIALQKEPTFPGQKEVIKEFKCFLIENDLVFTEPKGDPHLITLHLEKKGILSKEECEILRKELHLPTELSCELIKRAVTPSSESTDNYEELEYVGDAVLAAIVSIDSFLSTLSMYLDGKIKSVESDARNVVSSLCSNMVISTLLPAWISNRLDNRAFKVRADFVEALVGAVYDGECGLDKARDFICRLCLKIPNVLDELAGKKNDKMTYNALLEAWSLCPYVGGKGMKDESVGVRWLKFDINLLRQPQQKKLKNYNSHSSMVGFPQIPNKVYATHFGGSEYYCHRIPVEDLPLLHNRLIYSAARGEAATVNEIATPVFPFALAIEGANIFSFGFLFLLEAWAQHGVTSKPNISPYRRFFFVTSTCSVEKLYYHVYFPNWMVTLKEYPSLIKSLKAYVVERRSSVLQRLAELCICSKQFSVITTCTSNWFQCPSRCADDGSKDLSLWDTMRKYQIGIDQVVIGDSTHDKLTFAVLNFVKYGSETEEYWIVSIPSYKVDTSDAKDLLVIQNMVQESLEITAEKVDAIYLDDCFATRHTLRMLFCNVHENTKKVMALLSVNPFLVCGLPACSAELSPTHSPLSWSQEVSMTPVVTLEEAPARVTIKENELYSTDEDPCEEWEERYSPKALREATDFHETPLLLSYEAALALSALRGPTIRNVEGSEYSVWKQASSSHAMESSPPAFDLSRWRVREDDNVVFPGRKYEKIKAEVVKALRGPRRISHSVKISKEELVWWRKQFEISMSSTRYHLLPPFDGQNDKRKSLEKENKFTAEPRCLLPSWIMTLPSSKKGELPRIAFVVGGEVVISTDGSSPSWESTNAEFFWKLVYFFSPHYLLRLSPKHYLDVELVPKENADSFFRFNAFKQVVKEEKRLMEVLKQSVQKKVMLEVEIEALSFPVGIRVEDLFTCNVSDYPQLSKLCSADLVVLDDENIEFQPKTDEVSSLLQTCHLLFRNVCKLSKCKYFLERIKVHEYSEVVLLSRTRLTDLAEAPIASSSVQQLKNLLFFNHSNALTSCKLMYTVCQVGTNS